MEVKRLELPNVTFLDIGANKMENFPLIWAEKLTEIDFSGNTFKRLENFEKSYMPNIKNLSFSDLQLES